MRYYVALKKNRSLDPQNSHKNGMDLAAYGECPCLRDRETPVASWLSTLTEEPGWGSEKPSNQKLTTWVCLGTQHGAPNQMEEGSVHCAHSYTFSSWELEDVSSSTYWADSILGIDSKPGVLGNWVTGIFPVDAVGTNPRRGVNVKDAGLPDSPNNSPFFRQADPFAWLCSLKDYMHFPHVTQTSSSSNVPFVGRFVSTLTQYFDFLDNWNKSKSLCTKLGNWLRELRGCSGR